jgi:DUF4097 and DUF4098 domain-containing protein YvlB
MKSSHRCAYSAAALAAALLATMASPAFAHKENKHFVVRPHPVIVLHNSVGTITIHSWPKSAVDIVADHSSSQIEIQASQQDNLIEISTHLLSENVSVQDMRTDYDISVPEDAELQIHDDEGSVQVLKVGGDTAVDTATAVVALSDMGGYLSVKTIGGSVDCTRCNGRIEISSFSGNLQFLDGRSSSVRAQTTNGNILYSAALIPSGTYFLKNYSGHIEFRFSSDDSFSLRATSLHGKVFNDAKLTPTERTIRPVPREARSMFGNVNEGRAHVEVTSFDGTINIHKRD